eukprot:CAMPEP_0197455320 /NCGR_PEP_ID=MMETSP1175-20131217/40472_1 /TAXON_ID=1003142 /ORGANISM="Triceratium dubium, Strain CCMP147" /LENGTH=280 /DNA_ID=CAMNT_0042989143 /DNA_START=20 /DNA_END=862 /DNA_ORIENTATION=+
MMVCVQMLAAAAALVTSADAFALNGLPANGGRIVNPGWAAAAASTTRHGGSRSDATTTTTTMALSSTTELLSLELEKPLGMILEEIEEGEPMGVKIEELSEAGSAYASEHRDRLVGLKVARVMGEDVTAVSFDDVMEKIIDAPSPVSIDLEVEAEGSEAEEGEESAEEEPAEEEPVSFDLGTPVTITVIQDGQETPVQAKVGDNLRKTLLENKIELYKGLKKKLGNCGGVGQCTYCAIDFVEGEGWLERSEYEDGRLGKFPTARLACMNNIMGPATIRVQ